MKFSEALLIVKEFFHEILGFLLPGLIMLLLPVFFLKDNMQKSILSIFDKAYHVYIVILFAYLLGYSIYGASEILAGIEWNRSKWKFKKITGHLFFSKYKSDLEVEIEKSTNFRTAKKILIDLGGIDSPNSEIKVRQVRNLVMSFISHAEKSDIYTFTFRSDLCRHLSTVLKCYLLLTIIFLILNQFLAVSQFLDSYLTISQAWGFVMLLIFSIFILFFEKARRRFYSISHRIPYSVFIARIKNIRLKKDEE